MRHRIPCLAVLCAAALLSACGPQQVGPGGTMHLTFTAAPGLNPGKDGVSNPVQLRVYALKAPDKFLNADYFQLAEKDGATLGSDLLSRQDVSIRPGATQTVDATVLPGQTVLGISVAFRDIDHATWRVTTPLVSPRSFRVEADKIVEAK